jgi:hypothetical protein
MSTPTWSKPNHAYVLLRLAKHHNLAKNKNDPCFACEMIVLLANGVVVRACVRARVYVREYMYLYFLKNVNKFLTLPITYI